MNIGKLFFLGFLVGLRSMTLPAVVSDYLATDHNDGQSDSTNGLLSDPTIATITKALAAGELMMDKMPFLPARTTVLPLAERMGVAGFLAAGLTDTKERIPSALIAGLSAIVGSYVGYELRRRASKLNISDVALAATEDALAIGGSLLWRNTYLKQSQNDPYQSTVYTGSRD